MAPIVHPGRLLKHERAQRKLSAKAVALDIGRVARNEIDRGQPETHAMGFAALNAPRALVAPSKGAA